MMQLGFSQRNTRSLKVDFFHRKNNASTARMQSSLMLARNSIKKTLRSARRAGFGTSYHNLLMILHLLKMTILTRNTSISYQDHLIVSEKPTINISIKVIYP